jgi:hypothetical protein
VGLGSIIPHGSISLSVTFGMPDNHGTENVVFNVMEVNLPFNANIGSPTLYQFMAVTHYGYLVLNMPSPNGIIRIHGDRSTGVYALEKLQALAAALEVAAAQAAPDQAPSSSHQCVSSFAPHV